MAERFGASVVIDRPIDQVLAFLADGENDKKFCARVVEISKTTDGPSGKGTVYKSTVKDAGFKTKREFELTEFEPPTRIRWTERSKNLVTAPLGGYDLIADGEGTGSRSPPAIVSTSSTSTASAWSLAIWHVPAALCPPPP